MKPFSQKPRVGTVYLVGAGPGDPDLITVKGLRILRCADVVLYDRLSPSQLLREVKPDSEIIYVGKSPQKGTSSKQVDINRVMIEYAQAGKTVIRLKGGDPFIFGRGGEEALICAAHSIPFELVPGVTSITAVPAYAGVSITHRDYNNTFAVFSAHNDPDVYPDAVNYHALAALGVDSTLIMMMGTRYLDKTLARLIEAGLPRETPAMIIEWGTTDKQRVTEACTSELAAVAVNVGVKPPATIVVGRVTSLRHKGMKWFSEQGWIS